MSLAWHGDGLRPCVASQRILRRLGGGSEASWRRLDGVLEASSRRIFVFWKRFEGLRRGLEAARTLVCLRKRS